MHSLYIQTHKITWITEQEITEDYTREKILHAKSWVNNVFVTDNGTMYGGYVWLNKNVCKQFQFIPHYVIDQFRHHFVWNMSCIITEKWEMHPELLTTTYKMPHEEDDLDFYGNLRSRYAFEAVFAYEIKFQSEHDRTLFSIMFPKSKLSFDSK